jgi:hypothetical protein
MGRLKVRGLSRIRESRVNVRQLGAKGDGTTDDTVAFAAAFLLAGKGGTVYAPRGVYVLDDLGFTHEGQALIGDGMSYATSGGGTILVAKAGADYTLTAQGKRYCRVQDLVISGNERASRGFLYEAAAGASAQNLTMTRVMFLRCTRGWHIGPGAGGVNQADKNTLINCEFIECDYGLYDEATNSQHTILINCDFGTTYVTSIYLTAGTLKMLGGQFQGSGAAGTRGIHFAGFNIGWVNLEDVIFEGPEKDIDDAGSCWPQNGLLVTNVVFQGPTWNVNCNTANGRMSARATTFNEDFDPPTIGGGIVTFNQAGGKLLLEHCVFGEPMVTGAVPPTVTYMPTEA